ncbi:FadR/GntR family transcriptional regulator, partial [Propionibacterium freudenreichii]
MQASSAGGVTTLEGTERCQDCAIMRARGMSGFDIALHHIQSEILSGHYVAGMQLPTERELAASLAVGRGAVREALRVLQAQGIVVSGTGPGNGTRIRTTPGDALGQMLRLHLALESTSVPDLTQTRLVVERAATEMAAHHASVGALKRARAIVERMEQCPTIDEFNDLDTAFHIAIVDASGNHMLTMMSTAIRQTLAIPIRSAEASLTNWDDFRDGLVAQHRAILEAVTDGDAERAAELAEGHIRHAYAQLLPDKPIAEATDAVESAEAAVVALRPGAAIQDSAHHGHSHGHSPAAHTVVGTDPADPGADDGAAPRPAVKAPAKKARAKAVAARRR